MPRFFVNPEQVQGSTITITGGDAKHIATVLRGKVGEEVTVCSGAGTDYDCTIAEVSDKTVRLKIEKQYPNISEPEVKISLFQGLPKGDKMETVLQKCVELGVCDIVPVACARSIVKLDKKDGKKQERWQKVAEAAAKQSGRGIVPAVGRVLPFREAIVAAKALDAILIPYEEEKQQGLKDFCRSFTGKTIGVFIGPEGGFTPEEVQLAECAGAVPVTLGRRILRTETAGMVTLAILLHKLESRL